MKWRGKPTPAEARKLQEKLSRNVRIEPLRGLCSRIAGVDISVEGERARAAICVFSYPELELIEEAIAERAVEFPYVPGLLGFREVPAIAQAAGLLRTRPDVLIVDGHGLAHPRRFGVACHAGVVLDLPAIGCGKSRLIGVHREPGRLRGARVRLLDGEEVIGKVLRTRTGVRPVYVSVGHRIDLDAAVRIVLRCASRYRLPEPIRRADHLAGL